MYPAFLISLIALITKDKQTFKYVFPLSVIGALFSTWQTLEQWFPNTFSTSSVCNTPTACSIPEFTLLGFIVPPLFALVAFVLTGISAILGRPYVTEV